MAIPPRESLFRPDINSTDIPSLCLMFSVPGKPIAQGSPPRYKSASTGKMITPNPKGLKRWRKTVGEYALAEMNSVGLRMTDGPVVMAGVFCFKRPKCHFRTGRYSHTLRDDSPGEFRHLQYPDLDKLVRAIFDSLTKVCYMDDSQVCFIRGFVKMWVEDESRAIIKVGW